LTIGQHRLRGLNCAGNSTGYFNKVPSRVRLERNDVCVGLERVEVPSRVGLEIVKVPSRVGLVKDEVCLFYPTDTVQ
jgi:hypothetical protein